MIPLKSFKALVSILALVFAASCGAATPAPTVIQPTVAPTAIAGTPTSAPTAIPPTTAPTVAPSVTSLPALTLTLQPSETATSALSPTATAAAQGSFVYVHDCHSAPNQLGIPSTCDVVGTDAKFKQVEFRVPIETFFNYSPVTDRILFGSLGSRGQSGTYPTDNLQMLDVKSGKAEPVVQDGVVARALWAHNGRDLVYLRATKTTYELRWHSASGADKLLAAHVQLSFRVSPSGEYVAFKRETLPKLPGKPGVYVVSVSDAKERQLFNQGPPATGSPGPYWSLDSKYFLMPMAQEVYLFAIDGSVAAPVYYDPALAKEPWFRPELGTPIDKFSPPSSCSDECPILWHPDGHHLVGSALGPAGEGGGDPKEVMLYDLNLATKKIISGTVLADDGQVLAWDKVGESVWVLTPGAVKSIHLPK